MGLAPDVDSLARQHAPYHRALALFVERLAPTWSAALPPAQQDALLRDLEAADGATFTAVLELVYLAYYGDSRVHRRVGWRADRCSPRVSRWRRSTPRSSRPPAGASRSGDRPDRAASRHAAGGDVASGPARNASAIVGRKLTTFGGANWPRFRQYAGQFPVRR